MYSIFVLQLFMFFGIVITMLPSFQLNSLNINSFMWTTMLCFYLSAPLTYPLRNRRSRSGKPRGCNTSRLA